MLDKSQLFVYNRVCFEGRDNMKRSIKTIISTYSAFAIVLANIVTAFAAPAEYTTEDDIRAKALGEYLSSSTIILSMKNNAATSHEALALGSTTADAVAYKDVAETEEIPYNTIKRLNTSMAAGETQTVREGQNGEISRTVKIKYVNGVEVEKTVINETVVSNPVDKIVEYGSANTIKPANGGSALSYKYVIQCEATAYDLSPEENGGYGGQTATGVPLDKGVIAVDPRVIPLGSRVYVEALDGSWSYGYAVAADTGGAIKGKRVDLCFRTRSECIQFGRRKCRVYVLN